MKVKTHTKAGGTSGGMGVWVRADDPDSELE